jgi:hypothetical protein
MPPLYDEITASYEAVVDGLWHVVSLDLEDSTLETAEEAWFGSLNPGEGSLWLKIDLSDRVEDEPIPFWFFAKKTSGNYDTANSVLQFRAILHLMSTYAPDGFDESAPDYSLLSFENVYTMHSWVRESTNHDETAGFTLLGGYIYYLRVTPDGIGQSIPLFGTIEFGYAVEWTTTTSDVTVDFNSGNGVTESGGVLTEDQGLNPDDFTGQYPSPIDAPYTFKVSGAELPPSGLYRCEVEARCTTTPMSETLFVLVRRNGMPIGIGYMGTFGSADLTSSFAWREITDYAAFGSYNVDAFGPSQLPVLGGDEYEFAFYNWYDDDGSEAYEIQGLRWRPYYLGGSPGPAIKLLDIPDIPAGATDFDDIPDLGALAGENGYDPWLFDMAVDDNGDAYITFTVSSTANPGNIIATVLKWDGSNWTLITNDPFNLGGDGSFTNNGNVVDSVQVWSMDCDGTDLYFAFGITIGSVVSFGNFDSEIRITKVTPGGSVSAVGSAIAPLASATYASMPGQYTQGIPYVKCSPAGVPWVAFGQNDPTNANAQWANYGFVFRFNGSTWVDTNFWDTCAFVNPHSSPTAESGDINGVDPYPKAAIELAFKGSSEAPFGIYNVWYDASPFDDDQPVGETYVSKESGSDTWASPTVFRFGDYFPPGDEFQYFQGQQWAEIAVQAMRMVASQNGVYVAAALWSGLEGTGGITALKINDDLTLSPIQQTALGPRRPYDASMLWVDPTAVELGVTDEGGDSIWIGYDSNLLDWHPVIAQIADTGTYDGFAWASKENMPIASNADGTGRLIAKDGIVYWLVGAYFDNVANGDKSGPQLWVMPISDEVYIPWIPGGFRPHIYRRILG